MQESGLILKPVKPSAPVRARWNDWGNGSADNIRASGSIVRAKRGRRHDRTHDYWALVEPEAPRAPRWVEPVSAVGRREHASA